MVVSLRPGCPVQTRGEEWRFFTVMAGVGAAAHVLPGCGNDNGVFDWTAA